MPSFHSMDCLVFTHDIEIYKMFSDEFHFFTNGVFPIPTDVFPNPCSSPEVPQEKSVRDREN